MQGQRAAGGERERRAHKERKEQTEEEVRPEGQAGKFERLVKKKNMSDSMNRVRF